MFYRSLSNYDRDLASLASGLSCPEPTRAQQQFKDECDIMEIVRRFGLTGQMPVAPRTPSYGDFGEVFDYQTALNALLAAQDSFMELPADVRRRFDNDPQKLLLFMEDDRNRDEAVRLGLVTKPVVPGSSREPPAPDASTAS